MAGRSEFEAMAATFGETARGRWFLGEVARQARAEETRVLLDAVRRLERAVLPDGDADATPPVRAAAPEAHGFVRAVMDAAEEIQETAWAMREEGADPRLCDSLDRSAAALHLACTRQAEAGDGLADAPAADKGGGERFRLLP